MSSATCLQIVFVHQTTDMSTFFFPTLSFYPEHETDVPQAYTPNIISNVNLSDTNASEIESEDD